MNKEIKSMLQLLALILPVFVLGVIGWLHSPMYANAKAEERQNAQDYLIENYFFPNPLFDREGMIKDYGFTDDEINPSVIFSQFIDETPPNQNPGGLK